MADSPTPTLFEWAGGMPALDRWFTRFYERVSTDPALAPVFKHAGTDHAHHVARFVAEVLGGPKEYSQHIGSHAKMVQHHFGRNLTDALRKRWMTLLLECADEVQLPDDPEFRSALVSYLEWGTRLAVINSQPGATVSNGTPMPKWGWGEVKGPYKP